MEFNCHAYLYTEVLSYTIMLTSSFSASLSGSKYSFCEWLHTRSLDQCPRVPHVVSVGLLIALCMNGLAIIGHCTGIMYLRVTHGWYYWHGGGICPGYPVMAVELKLLEVSQSWNLVYPITEFNCPGSFRHWGALPYYHCWLFLH